MSICYTRHRIGDKMKYLKSLLVLPFLIALNVYADECSYKEQANLNKEAALIEANYEVIKEQEPYTFEDPDGLGTTETTRTITTFKIKIYNIAENLSLNINERIGNKAGSNKVVTYADTENGVYTFTSDNLGDIIDYTIKASALSGGCAGKTIRTMTFKKPRVNPYAGYDICKGHESVQYCEEFTTKEFEFTEAKLEEVLKDIDKTNNGGDTTNENGFLKFLKNNYIYIIVGVVVIGAGTGAYFIYRKKRVL